MDWCVQSYEASNHHPKVALNGDSTMTILRHRLGPGQRLLFDAHTSSDPDGDDLTFRWWMYEEPSSYDNTVQIDAMDSSIAFVRYRKEASGHTLHLILEVTDSGAPALTAYRRVLIEVE
jgi:hypothetical protein